MTRMTDQELGGRKLSISSFLGVGNRPPRKKKIGNLCARGPWLQIRLNHVLREVFPEKAAFSVCG